MINRINLGYNHQANIHQRKNSIQTAAPLWDKPQYDLVSFSKAKNNNSLLSNLISFTSNLANKLQRTPTIAIIDSFNKKEIDIDGDGIKDISHGKTICNIIKAQIPDVTLKTYRIKCNADGGIDNDSVVNKLHSIVKAVKSGEKIDGVNISLGASITFNEISSLLGQKITQKNIPEHKDKILNLIEKFNLPESKKNVLELLMPGIVEQKKAFFKETKEYMDAIKELVELNIPINVAAGNEGSEYFDPISLIDGVNNVGATDAKGHIADFSCKNALVNNYDQGVFNISKVFGKNDKLKGYDITGTGKPEVLASDVSGTLEENIVEKFDGKPASEVVASPKYQQLFEILTRMSDPEDCYKLMQSRKRLEQDLTLMNDKLFVVDDKRGIISLTDASMMFMFTIDNKTGNVNYNPDKSKRKAINVLEGTSFSSPLNLAKKVKAKFEATKK